MRACAFLLIPKDVVKGHFLVDVSNLRHVDFSRAFVRWAIAVLLTRHHLAILLSHSVACDVMGIEIRPSGMPTNLHVWRWKSVVMVRTLVVNSALLHD